MGSDNESHNTKHDYKALIRKRTQIKGRVTRIKNFLDSFDADVHSISNLKSRLQKLDYCWSEFNSVQMDIRVLSYKKTRSRNMRSMGDVSGKTYSK